MNEKFDTAVQELKYKVLKEVAISAFNDSLLEDYSEIPYKIVTGNVPTFRDSIDKERMIVLSRIKIALGGNKNIDNVVEVIKQACDECPLGGFEVTSRCRGCIAHRCQKVCPKDAIRFDAQTRAAIIDKDKCINCGLCAKACPYFAIQNYQRPCEMACKVKAISKGEDNAAIIDDNKCVHCGACVYQCPFGAIMDKSQIVDVINEIKNKKDKLYAVVAPSIKVQFKNGTVGQIITAIKRVGFDRVYEAALGADMVAYKEAKELEEKGVLTSSCCPTFVTLIEKRYPLLKEKISTNLSPMATIAKWLKEREPNSKVVFIGPCVAKKAEIKREEYKGIVDYVLTFEELNALIDARGIDATTLKETNLTDASYFGRIFGRVGGLKDAVVEALKEHNSSFELKPLSVDGIENCNTALTKLRVGVNDFNFLEGMACSGGCIGGPCCLTHEVRDKVDMDRYGKEALKQLIKEAIDIDETL